MQRDDEAQASPAYPRGVSSKGTMPAESDQTRTTNDSAVNTPNAACSAARTYKTLSGKHIQDLCERKHHTPRVSWRLPVGILTTNISK